MVTITGEVGQNALSIPTGNVNLGNGKLVVNQNGVENFGVNVCTASVTSAVGASISGCNSVVGELTITIPPSGGMYPLQAGYCSDNLNFLNNKISSANSVVIMTLTSYDGLVATQTIGAGVPYILTGAVATGGVQIFVCNVGSQSLSGVVKVKFFVASA